ncbi:sensor histidine kinase [Haloglycomyces albus]|uniref:sensor histidine kinase n=1 Tax=Haloglycomyces albus TaxID=526067 RepID=UPI00046D530F|nr:sensor histidine kinase [Haloglycomyces albus]
MIRDRLGDFIVATVVSVVIVTWTALEPRVGGYVDDQPGLYEPIAWICLAIACLVLYFRSSFPVTVLIVTTLCNTVYYPASGIDGPVALTFIIALYTSASRGYLWTSITITAVPLTLAFFGQMATGFRHVDPLNMFLLAGWFVAIIAVGGMVHKNRQYRSEAEARIAAAHETAVNKERLRIARELHDAVGHHLSVIRVQSVAAQRKLSKRPDHSPADTLELVAQTSQHALQELRSIVGVLRSDEDGTSQQGLAQIRGMVGAAESAGLTTALEFDDLPDIPSELEQNIFRVTQEAITNVVRHAHASLMTVVLRGQGDHISVTVTDDGVGGVVHEGNGITGLRERVQNWGGTVVIRNRQSGGTIVEVTWPLKR